MSCSLVLGYDETALKGKKTAMDLLSGNATTRSARTGEGGELKEPGGAAWQRHQQFPGCGEDLGVQAGRAAGFDRQPKRGTNPKFVLAIKIGQP
ncbi:hypothetical protein ACFY4K_17600 [Streptomyces leeuwenhoekii]|uniref:hypothetical protein n=1 Tax=Streptomyces leeuwenhoekii TaxID=1437453 RepID=UPI0036A8B5AE